MEHCETCSLWLRDENDRSIGLCLCHTGMQYGSRGKLRLTKPVGVTTTYDFGCTEHEKRKPQ